MKRRFDMRGCSRDPLSNQTKVHHEAMGADMHEAPPHPFFVWLDKHCVLLIVLSFILLLVMHHVTYDPAYDRVPDYRP